MNLTSATSRLMNKGALSSGDRILGFLRFTFTGGLATLTYLLAFFILSKQLPYDPKIISLFAYGFGFCVSYIGQTFITFKQTGWNSVAFKRFMIVSILGAILSWFIIAITSDILHMNSIIGALITATLIPVISFIIMNFWVFIRKT